MNRLLWRKLRRDLTGEWLQFVSVFLMALMSVLIYAGLEGAWHGLQVNLDDYASQQHLANYWVNGTQITADDAAKIKQLTHATDIKLTKNLSLTVNSGSEVSNLEVSTIAPGLVSVPVVRSGAALDSGKEGIWLDQRYADEHHIAIGSNLVVEYAGRSVPLMVRGTVLAPDKIYYTGSSAMVAPDPSLFGFGFIDDTTASNQLGYNGPATELQIVGGEPSIRDIAPEVLGSRYISFSDRASEPAVSTAFDRVIQIRDLSVMFSAVFILLALLSMYTSVRRMVEMQARELATIKAMGYSDTSIGWHYASYGLVACVGGGILGLALSPAMSWFVLTTQRPMFALPSWPISYTPLSIGVFSLVVGVCLLAAWMASRGPRRRTPAEGMRPRAEAQVGWLARSTWLQRLAYGNRWAVRDALANPARILMGVVAVMGCMMLLIAGFGMPDSMNRQVTSAFGGQYRYEARVALAATGSSPDRTRISQDAMDPQWAMEVSARTTPDDGHERVLTVIEPGDHVHLTLTSGKPADLNAGPYVSQGMADALGLRTGDSLEVRAAGDESFRRLTISGIVNSSQPQGIFVSRDAWQEVGGSFRPTTVFVATGSRIDDMRDNPDVSYVLPLSSQIQNAHDLVKGLSGIFTMIRSFAIILAIVVLYNLGALGFTERIREYTTLHVLGYRRGEIRTLAMRENVSSTLVGWLLGVPIGFVFLAGYVGMFTNYSIKYYPHITSLSIIVCSAVTLLTALTTTFLITERVRRIDMVSALKGVE